MAIDPETITFLPTYRVGFQPPEPGSLSEGELYLQIAGAPRLWVGTLHEAGYEGNLMCLIEAPQTNPPVNRDVPYVSQQDDTLHCTMGNWIGEPTAYAYQWRRDGEAVGTDADTYVLTVDDAGATFECVVSATNDIGTTDAPPSNQVIATWD